ncbi:Crp/Fnr family transcriptional regulator [Anaerofilum sp. BX8]|uniref:Crp/Fnr family transcriptional regulator n=1 Tax=Anaerofilum hominis TaxID=2763016 RepID=A0A923L1Z6_9FIRM|nr:Crp/Fnr family transcriptional regulator [Anaerofilum hominis]MBC5582383.1 Crp/Fnr family transcriptional regulator [Anaerofilum hominis]
MEKSLQALRACPLFEGICDAELDQLLPCLHARRRSCPRGAVLLRESERAFELGIVLTGLLALEKTDRAGNLNLVAQAGPGELFGDPAACAAGSGSGVSVRCAQAAEVLLIELDQVTRRCSRACAFHSRLVQNLLRLLGRGSLSLEEKIEVLSQRTIREKLLCCLQAERARAGSPRFTLPFSRSQLADYICADRSAMTRELGRMQQEGLLELHGRAVRLLE